MAFITRPLAGFGLPDCLRISIGTMQENQFCIARLQEVLQEYPALRDAIVASNTQL